MSVLSGYLMPHPPIMIEEVGGKEARKVISSINAANTVGSEIAKLSPDTVVIISPHGPIFADALCIYDFSLKGSLASFGAPEVKMSFERDAELADEVRERANRRGISTVTTSEVGIWKYGFKEELDHGVIVPMYFIAKYSSNFKLMPLSFGMLPYEDLYEFGKLIQESAKVLNKKIVVIASGDLSHRLTKDAPVGYDPYGKIFDEKLVDALRKFDLKALRSIDPVVIDRAGECGLRSVWIMAGALDGCKVEPEVLSYEGPFGVGYCIARFKVAEQKEDSTEKPEKETEDPYVKLARYTLETYVKEGVIPPLPKDLPEEMIEQRAGVFVSIKKGGQLRGCIGTFLPTRKNIAEEIQRNAISTGCEDPRFYPVGKDELCELEYSVDVLTEPVPVYSIDELDPKKYGILVRKGYKSGLLLPDLEGVDTVEQQLRIALAKAGIRLDEDYEIYKFEVERHEEK